MSGESRVLRVSWLNSKLSLQDAPPVFGALGVIGVGDMLKPYIHYINHNYFIPSNLIKFLNTL